MHFETEMNDTWDVANQIPFLHTLRALFVIGQINLSEYNNILKLNSARNKIIHQLLLEPYEKINPGLSKKEVDNIFKKFIEMFNLIEAKTHNFK